MRRRTVLKGMAMLIASQAALLPRCKAEAASANVVSRVRPGLPGWPSEVDWAALNQAVGGHLSPAFCACDFVKRDPPCHRELYHAVIGPELLKNNPLGFGQHVIMYLRHLDAV